MQHISISIGPGQHDKVILDILQRTGQLKQSFHTFPNLLFTGYNNGEIRDTRKIKSFDNLQRLVWSAWRQIPYWRQFETPRSWLLPLADKLISRNLEPCDIFIGWLQLSLASMKRAHDFGARVVLEHQMSHISTWTDLVTQEYDQWGSKSGGFSSLFPRSLAARIEREYERADVINVLSTYAKRSFIENGVRDEKIVVTTFGVDEKAFMPAAERKERKNFRILYAGRLELLKGIQYLLQAFTQIKGKHLELTLVGQVLPEIIPVLAKYSDDRIEVVGPVSADILVSYYQNADVFVFPSINDAFGLVVLEAMSCGVPVVTTDHSCGEDLVTNGEDGFVIPSRQVSDIKEKLEFFIENRQAASDMGRKARLKVEGNFTLQHYRDRYIAACGIATNKRETI